MTVTFNAETFAQDFAGLDQAILTLRDSNDTAQKSIEIKNPAKCPTVSSN